MRPKLCILASLLFIANLAMAYTITGTVTGKGKPLPGAVVSRIGFLGDSNTEIASTVADIDGKYSIDSGSGDPIMLVASFVSYTSEIKMVESQVVSFDLKETPYVPVKFFSSLLDQSAILSFTLVQQLKGMGSSDFPDAKIYLSGNTLVFSIITSKDSAVSGLSIKNLSDPTIKGYLRQLQSEGELDGFLSQMKSSGMKWGFGVYSTFTGKWLQYKEYNADQIIKLL